MNQLILSKTVTSDATKQFPNSMDCNEGRSIALFIYIYNKITYLEL